MKDALARQASVSQPAIVLIVEDDDSNREMYSAYLESAGYWVLGARNGAEGLTEARRSRPQVVVTDITMPGMDGWQLARALREDTHTTGIGIIAVSGRTYDEGADRETARHVDVVLMKPCLPDDLLREIRKLIARTRLAQASAKQQIARADGLQPGSQAFGDRTKPPARQRRRS